MQPSLINLLGVTLKEDVMETNIKIADAAKGAFQIDSAMLVGAENCVRAFMKDPALKGVVPTIRIFRTQRFGRNHLLYRNWERICIPKELGILSGEKSYYSTLQYTKGHKIDPGCLLNGRMARFPDKKLFSSSVAFDEGWGESLILCTCVKNGNEADFFFLRILPPKKMTAGEMRRGFEINLHAAVSMDEVLRERKEFTYERAWDDFIKKLQLLGMEFYERTIRSSNIDPIASPSSEQLEWSHNGITLTIQHVDATHFNYRLQKGAIFVEYQVNTAQFGDVEMVDFFGCLEDFCEFSKKAQAIFSR